jgi:hypothetical protein
VRPALFRGQPIQLQFAPKHIHTQREGVIGGGAFVRAAQPEG